MKKKLVKILKISLPAAGLLGLVVVLVNPGQTLFTAWLGGTIISFIFLFGILFVFEKLQSPKKVRVISTVNFLLRICTGIALFLLLPIFGYEEEPPQAGYLYLDAYRRDSDAWQIANSDESIFSGFKDDFYTDQYGGMLSLSAAIYRTFSPDAHRPVLILLITAFISTLGIPFYWQAIQERFNPKIATIASWLLALYPESIILGGSQMREPIVIGLSCIILWGIIHHQKDKRASIITVTLSFLMLLLISTRYAMAIGILVLLWIWVDHTPREEQGKNKVLRNIFLVLIILAGLFISWNWLVNTARWDLYLMESSSGRVQFELDNIGSQFRIPFLVIYGVLQPVLPAAIAYPGIAIMRSIAIFRSAGWYAIAPTLLLAPFFVRKEKDTKNRRVLIYTIAFILFWVFLSSLRAGGDQWDNPRYRTAILPWITLVTGWV
ncbi:MAG TPA: hypothetical protein DCK95_02155, partial [Anaerolineaceae bacterium]